MLEECLTHIKITGSLTPDRARSGDLLNNTDDKFNGKRNVDLNDCVYSELSPLSPGVSIFLF